MWNVGGDKCIIDKMKSAVDLDNYGLISNFVLKHDALIEFGVDEYCGPHGHVQAVAESSDETPD